MLTVELETCLLNKNATINVASSSHLQLINKFIVNVNKIRNFLHLRLLNR